MIFRVITKGEHCNTKIEAEGDFEQATLIFKAIVCENAIKAAQREGGDSITVELRRLPENELFKSVHIHNWQS